MPDLNAARKFRMQQQSHRPFQTGSVEFECINYLLLALARGECMSLWCLLRHDCSGCGALCFHILLGLL